MDIVILICCIIIIALLVFSIMKSNKTVVSNNNNGEIEELNKKIDILKSNLDAQSNLLMNQSISQGNSTVKQISILGDSLRDEQGRQQARTNEILAKIDNKMLALIKENADSLDKIRQDILLTLESIRKSNAESLNKINSTVKENTESLDKIRQEVLENFDRIRNSNTESLNKINGTVKENTENLDKIRQDILATFENIRRSNTESLDKINNTAKENTESLDKIRQQILKNLDDIRNSNAESLDKINDTVNEKLQKTLDDRISKSFETVNKRLAEVYEGLGEMKNVASGVSDLKNVLSNVKTRGIMGEIQLGAILNEILAPEQFEEQITVNPNSSEKVDFAVKLPGMEDGEYVYLPIDSKFPGDTYSNLLTAYDSGNPDELKAKRKVLELEIKRCAKSIHDKYIVPPYTTDFAIMFLPFEGLYAEVVNMGLVEVLQKEYKINIAGPSTMAAMLNSLQMGFRTLAIQKKSGEVWKILEGAKKEFNNFEKVLNKTRERLKQADDELEKLVGTRTRAINRKLNTVATLDSSEDTEKLLDIN